jgi:hypothetical protein
MSAPYSSEVYIAQLRQWHELRTTHSRASANPGLNRTDTALSHDNRRLGPERWPPSRVVFGRRTGLDPTVSATVLRELYEYSRVEFQLYVAWFTFFLTLLLGSMAWSLRASLDEQGKVVAPFPYYCMVALFSAQLVFGIVGTEYIADDLCRADSAGFELLQKQMASTQGLPAEVNAPQNIPAMNPFPKGIHGAMTLMQWTLVTNLVFWLLVTVQVARKKGKRLTGNVGD